MSYAVAHCIQCDIEKDGSDEEARRLVRWARVHNQQTGHFTEVDVNYIYAYGELPKSKRPARERARGIK